MLRRDRNYVALGDPTAYTAAIDRLAGRSLADSQRFKDRSKVPSDASVGSTACAGSISARVAKQAESQSTPCRTSSPQLESKGTFTAAAQSGRQEHLARTRRVPGLGTPPHRTRSARCPATHGSRCSGDLGGKIKNLSTTSRQPASGHRQGTISALVQDRTNIDLSHDVFPWVGDAAIFHPRHRSAQAGRGAGDRVEGRRSGRPGDQLAARARPVDGQVAAAAPRPRHRRQRLQAITPSAPQAVNFVQQNGKVVIGLGDTATQDALTPKSTLGDAPSFAAATAPSVRPGRLLHLRGPGRQYLAATPSAKPARLQADRALLGAAAVPSAGGDNGLKIILRPPDKRVGVGNRPDRDRSPGAGPWSATPAWPSASSPRTSSPTPASAPVLPSSRGPLAAKEAVVKRSGYATSGFVRSKSSPASRRACASRRRGEAAAGRLVRDLADSSRETAAAVALVTG